MKNKRDIILDFTPLLDVMMLILFFFVFFSQSEASKQMQEAKDKWDEANKAYEQSQAAFAEYQQNNALAEAVILAGGKDFDRALRIKVCLEKNDAEWQAMVKKAIIDDGITSYEAIGVIESIRARDADKLAEDLNKIIEDCGYSSKDAFVCEIIFDSSADGTRLAIEHLEGMLKNLRDEYDYKYLFDSFLDLSDVEYEGGKFNEKN